MLGAVGPCHRGRFLSGGPSAPRRRGVCRHARGYLTCATHRTAELRSLALHALVADRTREDPEVLERARERVVSWLEAGGPVARRSADRWRELLDGPRDVLLEMLVAPTRRRRATFARSRRSRAWSRTRIAGASSARSGEMQREQLEQVIRAASAVTAEDDLVPAPLLPAANRGSRNMLLQPMQYACP